MARRLKQFPSWLNPNDEEDVEMWYSGEFIPNPQEIEDACEEIKARGGGRNRTRLRAELMRADHYALGDWQIAQRIAAMISNSRWIE